MTSYVIAAISIDDLHNLVPFLNGINALPRGTGWASWGKLMLGDVEGEDGHFQHAHFAPHASGGMYVRVDNTDLEAWRVLAEWVVKLGWTLVEEQQ